MTLQLDSCKQTIDHRGRLIVSKKAWAVRLAAVAALLILVYFQMSESIRVRDPLIALVSLLPLHAAVYMFVGWVLYRNPAIGHQLNESVSVIIPVFNQRSMIGSVIQAIYDSTYKNLAVIVVNDGSTDGTKEELDKIAKSGQYRNLYILHKSNAGKRKAVADGYYYNDKHIKSNYVVLIDSDSIVDQHAISEIMKTFGSNFVWDSDKPVGAVVGQARVLNRSKNLLTKCQDTWYDYAFNVRKAGESFFGNVTCCSGCLAAYRTDAIRSFIPYWVSRPAISDDREMTSWVIADPNRKKYYLRKIRENARKRSAAFDYAEDRALTAESLREWKAVYTASAIVYTECPETLKQFIRQQKRWKKGVIIVSAYMALYFWKKNPILSIIIFYTDYAMNFLSPILLIMAFVYIPIITQSLTSTLTFIAGGLAISIVQGLDYKFRNPNGSQYWYLKPLMNLLSGFVLSWLVIPSIFQLRRNSWETR